MGFRNILPVVYIYVSFAYVSFGLLFCCFFQGFNGASLPASLCETPRGRAPLRKGSFAGRRAVQAVLLGRAAWSEHVRIHGDAHLGVLSPELLEAFLTLVSLLLLALLLRLLLLVLLLDLLFLFLLLLLLCLLLFLLPLLRLLLYPLRSLLRFSNTAMCAATTCPRISFLWR